MYVCAYVHVQRKETAVTYWIWIDDMIGSMLGARIHMNIYVCFVCTKCQMSHSYIVNIC